MKKVQNIYLSIMLSIVIAILPVGNALASMVDTDIDVPGTVPMSSMHHSMSVDMDSMMNMVMDDGQLCDQCDPEHQCNDSHCSTTTFIYSSEFVKKHHSRLAMIQTFSNKVLITQNIIPLFRPPKV